MTQLTFVPPPTVQWRQWNRQRCRRLLTTASLPLTVISVLCRDGWGGGTKFRFQLNIEAPYTLLLRLPSDVLSVSRLSDASAALQVRALKDYCNNYDLTSLNIKAGDVITVKHKPNIRHHREKRGVSSESRRFRGGV